MMNESVLVYGAAGRIGLPFSVYLSKHYNVLGVDINEPLVELLNTGQYVPYKEEGLTEALKTAVIENFLVFKTLDNAINDDNIKFAQHHIILIGTPLNEKTHSLNIQPLWELIEKISQNCDPQMENYIYIRSTIPVGTTREIAKQYPTLHFIYWPERITEGHALEEFETLPNILAYDANKTQMPSLLKVATRVKLLTLTWEEAEFLKSATNSARLMQFSFSNYLQAASQQFVDVDINYARVFDAMKFEYPRLDFLSPPGLVGGPCLSKDWVNVYIDYYHDDLLESAYRLSINAPIDIIAYNMEKYGKKIWGEQPISNVLILGTSFKIGSDNEMHSPIFKVLERLEENRVFKSVTFYDPLVPGRVKLLTNDELSKFDVFILAMPHKEIMNSGIIERILTFGKPNSLFINLWHVYTNNNYNKYFKKFKEHSVFLINDDIDDRKE